MARKLFTGGTVVSGTECIKADVLVDGEKIVAVGHCLDGRNGLTADSVNPGGGLDAGDRETAGDLELVDLSGKLLFPGFIDGHTHMDLDVSDTVTVDGFDSGTRAEVAGGTTCIVDFATQNRGESLAFALEHWHGKADGKANCDYAFHLALSDWNESVSRELGDVVAGGICSFKLYTTYDGMVVNDQTIYEIFTRLKELGGIAGVHCENKGIIDARLGEVLARKGDRRNVSDYPWTRPALAEAEAVSRVLKIAACVDTPVIIVHLSSREGWEEVCRARERGQTVYVETCPQYLLMDRSRYSLPDEEARRYMIAPPLRGKEDQQVLWKALADGEIQTIATDHCSFTRQQKEAGREDFSRTPCGMPGAEERPGLVYHFGVGQGRISLEQMCQYLAENPARLYRLYPRKGVIAPGSDADLVVWDPEAEWVLSEKTQQSAADYCPLEGTLLKGRAEQVYLRGRLVAWDGKLVEAYRGRYVTVETGDAIEL